MDQDNLFREAFSPAVARGIADRIVPVWPDFDRAAYSAALDPVTGPAYESLSFGARASRIVDALTAVLPADFRRASAILVAALGPEPEPTAQLEGFGGFYVMPLTMYVSRHGMDHPDTSLDALYHMTKRFTAEGDIRPFLMRYPDKTLAFLARLCDDPSPFARRLASEGTRPRLPLFSRLKAFQIDPAPIKPLLDRLWRDPSPMVRRSVANNINDIAKDHPDTAVAWLSTWLKVSPGPETRWLVRHGLRTLIKTGHPGALALLGMETSGLAVRNGHRSPGRLSLTQTLSFGLDLVSTADTEQKLALNYIIHFVKARGTRAPKVFRLPTKVLEPGAILALTKAHHFKALRNQTFYSGMHRIEITANGQTLWGEDFWLEVPYAKPL